MYRGIGLIVWIGLLVFTGCFNRSATSPFGTNARVPAPGTYNVRIPSLASNQPYYSPGQQQQLAASPVNPPAPTIDPNASAPTLDNRNVNGWSLVNGNVQQASNAPVYQTPYVMQANRSVPTANYQTSAASTLTSSGPAIGNSNLARQTNPSLSRPDSTRMAAIDVSGVRASGLPQANPILPPAGSSTLMAQGPQQYFGRLQAGGIINPPAANNGFVQPAAQNRYAVQPVVGMPGSYQSPYVRNNGVYAPSIDPNAMGATGNVGWTARDGERSSNR